MQEERNLDEKFNEMEHGEYPVGYHVHTHVLEDGTKVTHSHGPSGENKGHHHHHPHQHENTKAVINRLAKAIGHLESVKRMVEDGRDCTEVLVQLAAVRSALNSTAKVILKDHLEHCVSDAGADNPDLQALNEAIDKFMS